MAKGTIGSATIANLIHVFGRDLFELDLIRSCAAAAWNALGRAIFQVMSDQDFPALVRNVARLARAG